VGYAFGSWLPYVSGGVAIGDIKKTIPAPGEPPDPTDAGSVGARTSSLEDDSWAVGWTIGGGLEWLLSSGWTAKAEYLYLGFSDVDCGSPCVAGSTVSANTNLIRFGLNRRF
jgi:opacity protein-like surface antigen